MIHRIPERARYLAFRALKLLNCLHLLSAARMIYKYATPLMGEILKLS